MSTTPAPSERLKDRAGAAHYLNISERLMRALHERREIPFVRVGGRVIRWDQADLDAYVEAHRVEVVTAENALIARIRELEEQVRAVRELCLLLDYDAVYDLKSDIIHIIGSVL